MIDNSIKVLIWRAFGIYEEGTSEKEDDSLNKKMLSLLGSLLPEREYKILSMRFGLFPYASHTLKEVGKQFDVTPERIRQIEAKALRKLRHPSRSDLIKQLLEEYGLSNVTLY